MDVDTPSPSFSSSFSSIWWLNGCHPLANYSPKIGSHCCIHPFANKQMTNAARELDRIYANANVICYSLCVRSELAIPPNSPVMRGIICDYLSSSFICDYLCSLFFFFVLRSFDKKVDTWNHAHFQSLFSIFYRTISVPYFDLISLYSRSHFLRKFFLSFGNPFHFVFVHDVITHTQVWPHPSVTSEAIAILSPSTIKISQ